MWFRLAALWGCTVREAQARCNAHEFSEWCAFYEIDPFGELRSDYRSALMTANIRRALGDNRCKVQDFLLLGRPESRPSRDWQTQKADMTAWAEKWNRKAKHGNSN